METYILVNPWIDQPPMVRSKNAKEASLICGEDLLIRSDKTSTPVFTLLETRSRNLYNFKVKQKAGEITSTPSSVEAGAIDNFSEHIIKQIKRSLQFELVSDLEHSETNDSSEIVSNINSTMSHGGELESEYSDSEMSDSNSISNKEIHSNFQTPFHKHVRSSKYAKYYISVVEKKQNNLDFGKMKVKFYR